MTEIVSLLEAPCHLGTVGYKRIKVALQEGPSSFASSPAYGIRCAYIGFFTRTVHLNEPILKEISHLVLWD